MFNIFSNEEVSFSSWWNNTGILCERQGGQSARCDDEGRRMEVGEARDSTGDALTFLVMVLFVKSMWPCLPSFCLLQVVFLVCVSLDCWPRRCWDAVLGLTWPIPNCLSLSPLSPSLCSLFPSFIHLPVPWYSRQGKRWLLLQAAAPGWAGCQGELTAASCESGGWATGFQPWARPRQAEWTEVPHQQDAPPPPGLQLHRQL